MEDFIAILKREANDLADEDRYNMITGGHLQTSVLLPRQDAISIIEDWKRLLNNHSTNSSLNRFDHADYEAVYVPATEVNLLDTAAVSYKSTPDCYPYIQTSQLEHLEHLIVQHTDIKYLWLDTWCVPTEYQQSNRNMLLSTLVYRHAKYVFYLGYPENPILLNTAIKLARDLGVDFVDNNTACYQLQDIELNAILSETLRKAIETYAEAVIVISRRSALRRNIDISSAVITLLSILLLNSVHAWERMWVWSELAAAAKVVGAPNMVTWANYYSLTAADVLLIFGLVEATLNREEIGLPAIIKSIWNNNLELRVRLGINFAGNVILTHSMDNVLELVVSISEELAKNTILLNLKEFTNTLCKYEINNYTPTSTSTRLLANLIKSPNMFFLTGATGGNEGSTSNVFSRHA